MVQGAAIPLSAGGDGGPASNSVQQVAIPVTSLPHRHRPSDELSKQNACLHISKSLAEAAMATMNDKHLFGFLDEINGLLII
jgi:hypothetical protein